MKRVNHELEISYATKKTTTWPWPWLWSHQAWWPLHFSCLYRKLMQWAASRLHPVNLRGTAKLLWLIKLMFGYTIYRARHIPPLSNKNIPHSALAADATRENPCISHDWTLQQWHQNTRRRVTEMWKKCESHQFLFLYFSYHFLLSQWPLSSLFWNISNLKVEAISLPLCGLMCHKNSIFRGLNKMFVILRAIFSNPFCWMNCFDFD